MEESMMTRSIPQNINFDSNEASNLKMKFFL